jgi:hypothetical protein
MLGASTGCVFGEPDFTKPERTRPELRAVFPALTEIRPQFLQDSESFAVIRFDAEVISEDDGQDLFAVLLENYGHRNPFDARTPFEHAGESRTLAHGTVSDGARPIGIPFLPRLENELHTCLSITMLVTHEPILSGPFRFCPKDVNDSATLTWFIPICDTLSNCDAQDCAREPEDGGFIYCPEDPDTALLESEP